MDFPIKESRVLARRIHDHLLQAHTAIGAQEESAGIVDVIYHPDAAHRNVNFVTPRRNMAHISSTHIEPGLSRLRELRRVPRFCYIDLLFLPTFGREAEKLGLQLEHRSALMIYATQTPEGGMPTRPLPPLLPSDVTMRDVKGEQNADLWKAVQRDAAFDIQHLGSVPVATDSSSPALQSGQQFDMIAAQNKTPVGLARLHVNAETKTAHLLALAVRKDSDVPELARAMLDAALRAALVRGCDLIFVVCRDPEFRGVCRSVGLVDFAQIVAYAPADAGEGTGNDNLDSPVLTL